MKDHIKIAMMMERFGGSFFQGIGQALLHADSENAAKVKATWPKEWQQYYEIYGQWEARQQTQEV